MTGISGLKANPSFIGHDGNQIDVTFYPAKSGYSPKEVKPCVIIRHDNTLSNRIELDPRDVPMLIQALEHVMHQVQETMGDVA